MRVRSKEIRRAQKREEEQLKARIRQIQGVQAPKAKPAKPAAAPKPRPRRPAATPPAS